MPAQPRLARAALHFGEEPCISGTNGSGTVFFSGCSLACRFCQNFDISHRDFGQTVSVERLVDIFKELVESGAHNINLVNPTHYAHAIEKALSLYRPPVPVVYNSSGYEKVETLRMLDGLIDIYLPDYKYADDDLALACSSIKHYRETALAAIEEMLRQVGHLRIENDLAVKGTLIRHLVLPGHTQNSLAVLDDIRSHFTTDVWVSLLFQYTPVRELPQKELNRTLTARECRKVFDAMCERGFENGYAQELESATTAFIPSFDLTGI
ncbi:MAG: radical SAM protein [Clostridia bacterium]|nr:radical SAM protein [Clostridia bacterium]